MTLRDDGEPMKWVAICEKCGARQTVMGNLTAKKAKAWAARWQKEHQEVCHERKA